MTPSILTAAQEGLRLAEKHALLPHALKPLQDFQQHARAHYADICRELIRLHEENIQLKKQLLVAHTLNPQV